MMYELVSVLGKKAYCLVGVSCEQLSVFCRFSTYKGEKLTSLALFPPLSFPLLRVHYAPLLTQLVGCWTPRVVGSIPGHANCFMWDNIL